MPRVFFQFVKMHTMHRIEQFSLFAQLGDPLKGIVGKICVNRNMHHAIESLLYEKWVFVRDIKCSGHYI